jgi:hypothetical protein
MKIGRLPVTRMVWWLSQAPTWTLVLAKISGIER